MPDLSVIVLNFNGERWLPACLDALGAQRDAPSFETIVVDNRSTDSSLALLGSKYPSVRVVARPTNEGFAGANNAGARAAAGEWLVFLNNDTAADPHWLARLRDAAAQHPDHAVLTSRLVLLDDASILDSAGDGYFRAGGAFKRGHRQPAATFAESGEVFGACGAALMIRRALFAELGGFDERFFIVYEDVDLSYRARLRGARVWYAADAIVRHAGSATMGTISPVAVYHGQRNLEWTWLKNSPASLLCTSAPAHLLYATAGVVHYARLGLGWPALRGKLAALAGLPATLAERRRVQRSRTVSAAELVRWMEPRWLEAKRREKAQIAAHVTSP